VIEYDFQPGRAMPEPPELTDAQREADKDDLQEALFGLAGIVVAALTVGELLTRVAQFATQAIPGVDGAGATAAHPSWARSRIQARAVAADFFHEIDTIQYEVHNEGPCITSMQTRRPCISGSIGDDPRWPRFGPAVARKGVHSALSLPLMLDDQVIGSISTYAHSPDAFAEYGVAMGAKFAGPAAVSVHNGRILLETQHRVEQLQRALASRSIVDQAIGLIRSQSGGSAEDALGRLVKISQSENTKLNDLAERLVGESVRRAGARHEQTRPQPPRD
jgi:transcriptional regulator with GAF, ATPase, and Fis domain